MKKSILIKDIFKEIEDALQQVDQWVEMKDYCRANKYSDQAEALIELVEVADCGSVGGFGNHTAQGITDKSLAGRYSWLKNKYTPVKIRKV